MCKVIKASINGREFNIADIKLDCIRNIADAAEKCDYIDRIIVFGSSVENRCTEESDVDIAVFGNVSKSRCLTSKKYKDFTRQLYRFNDHAQSYDILYFKSGQTRDDFLMSEINKGELIYEKK